jgi:hypothetical protein
LYFIFVYFCFRLVYSCKITVTNFLAIVATATSSCKYTCSISVLAPVSSGFLYIPLSPASAYKSELKKLKRLDKVERSQEYTIASQTLAILDQIVLQKAEKEEEEEE